MDKVGEVDDLIFDSYSRKVRYMKIDLKGKLLNTKSKEVLVPIGLAQLKNLTHTVQLNKITVEQLISLPEYDNENEITEATERQIFTVVGGTDFTGINEGNKFYEHEHFNDRNFYDTDVNPDSSVDANIPLSGSGTTAQTGVSGKVNADDLEDRGFYDDRQNEDKIDVIKENLEVGTREVETGGIRLRTRIVERPVEETINLREENVNIERTPVNQLVQNPEFTGKEIEIREHAEVPVLSKEARIVEEISISKEVEQHEKVINDRVRETKVEVENLAEHHADNDRR